MSPLKSTLIILALIIFGVITYFIFQLITDPSNIVISNFEECSAAGYEVTNTNPRECTTPDNTVFTEDLDITINSYTECAKAGYIILESYPEQCRRPDGKTFTRDIGNKIETNDIIRVENPKPGDGVKGPLKINGEARGQWYFEATFPVAIYDSNGREIARSFAEAQGDWMTEEFVPFSATIEFEKSVTKMGNLVLEKSNPSGLPENSAELRIPIIFENTIDENISNSQTSGGCLITGCSGQICSDKEVVTTCEYREIFACYENVQCGRNPSNGQCQWQETPELLSCIAKFGN